MIVNYETDLTSLAIKIKWIITEKNWKLFVRCLLNLTDTKWQIVVISPFVCLFLPSLGLFTFALRNPLVECMLQVDVQRNVNFLIDGEVILDRRDNSQLRFIERDQKRNIKAALGWKSRLPADARPSCGNCKNIKFYVSAFVLKMRHRSLPFNSSSLLWLSVRNFKSL